MLLEIGRVTKAHGVRGEVVVEVVSNRPERMAPGTRLQTARGHLEVQDARPAGGPSSRWIVAFAGIEDRSRAEALRGEVLSAEPLVDPEALWVHDLIGAEVVDTAGIGHGLVASVQANPASDLLVLASGALIPLRFLVNRSPGRLTVDVPDGLFEL